MNLNQSFLSFGSTAWKCLQFDETCKTDGGKTLGEFWSHFLFRYGKAETALGVGYWAVMLNLPDKKSAHTFWFTNPHLLACFWSMFNDLCTLFPLLWLRPERPLSTTTIPVKVRVIRWGFGGSAFTNLFTILSKNQSRQRVEIKQGLQSPIENDTKTKT